MKRVLIFLTLIVVLAACGPAETDSAEVVSVRLPMGYIPDPQYAPYYVAAEKGYFAEAGYEIEFDYSFETDGMALVGAGEVPFAVVSGEQVLLSRAQEVPVVYVLEWFQQYPIAIVSKAGAGIESPADLAGRNVGLPGFFGASYVGYAGLLSANGMAQEDVGGTDIGFTQYEAVLTDQVEAAVVYRNNEPVRLQGDGEDVNVINVSDYIDMVANGIITSEDMIENEPEKVEAFVHALLKGIEDTLADPDEAFEISKNFVEGLDDTRRPVLDATLPIWEATSTPGFSDPASWSTTQDVLMDMGFLQEALGDLDAAFTNEFVDTYE